MSNFTETAKSIKTGAVQKRERSVFGTLVNGYMIASTALLSVLGAGTVGYGGIQNIAHGTDYALSRANSPSESNYQVHGTLEDGGKAVIVTNSTNPNSYMAMKLRWDSKNYDKDMTYAQDPKGYGQNVIDVAMSPNMSTVEYDQFLNIAQKEAKKYEASLKLPDCSQTAKNIAGYADITSGYFSKSKNILAAHHNIIPFTYHQADKFEKDYKDSINVKVYRKSDNFFSTYKDIKDNIVEDWGSPKYKDFLKDTASLDVHKDQAPVTTEAHFKTGSETPKYSGLDM